jgi:tetratricopeptide (TPR) repeat protein
MKQRTVFFLAVLLTSTVLASAQDLNDLRNKVRTGHAEEAIPTLRGMVESQSKNLEAWLVLGDAYLRTEKWELAEEAGRKAVSINDEKPGGYVLVSRSFVGRKNFPAAFGIIEKGLKNIKNNHELHTQRGVVYLAVDSVDRAIVEFSRATLAEPNYYPALVALGDAYAKQKISALAVQQYEKAMAVDSMDTDLRFRLGQMYMKERRYGEAAQQYQQVLAVDSSNAKATLDLAKLYFAAKQFENSAMLFAKHLAKNPGDKDMWPFYMDALFYSRQFPDAIAVADKLLAADPNSAKALRVKARSHFEQKELQKATATYERLDKVDTLQLDEMQLMVKGYQEAKNDSLAVELFKRIVTKDPAKTAIWSDLGFAYMRAKKFDLAADAFEKRFTADPENTTAYLNYSLSNMFLGNWEKARVALRTVTAQKPDYVPGHLHLANTLAQMDSIREAKKEYELVIKLGAADEEKYKSEVGDARGRLGVQFLIDKQYPDALEYLTIAVKLKPDVARFHLWRGQTLQNLNRKDEAIREYKKTLELDPGNKEAKKGLEVLSK